MGDTLEAERARAAQLVVGLEGQVSSLEAQLAQAEARIAGLEHICADLQARLSDARAQASSAQSAADEQRERARIATDRVRNTPHCQLSRFCVLSAWPHVCVRGWLGVGRGGGA